MELCYRLLPQKTLAHAVETQAQGLKKAKDRVTINACANATGTIKLPLLLIGKSKRPRCFAGINMDALPVIYRSSVTAWVNAEIFFAWFHENFVPYVTAKLTEMKLEPKALLLLDNCSAHPEAAELTSADGLTKAVFLPVSNTSLIQPMDQGVLMSLKRNYRKQLMHDLVIRQEGTEMIRFLRALNMRDVFDRTAIAWDHVSQTTLRLSWRKLIPIEESDEETPESVDSELMTTLQEVAPAISVADVAEWFDSDGPGYEHLSEERITRLVTHEESETEDEEDEIEIVNKPAACPISNTEAMQAFDTCLTWLRYQEKATDVSVSMLLRLRELAAQKRESARKQSSMLSYFKPAE